MRCQAGRFRRTVHERHSWPTVRGWKEGRYWSRPDLTSGVEDRAIYMARLEFGVTASERNDAALELLVLRRYGVTL